MLGVVVGGEADAPVVVHQRRPIRPLRKVSSAFLQTAQHRLLRKTCSEIKSCFGMRCLIALTPFQEVSLQTDVLAGGLGARQFQPLAPTLGLGVAKRHLHGIQDDNFCN